MAMSSLGMPRRHKGG